MGDFCQTKHLQQVSVQENGIIRNSDGYLIGRTCDLDFDSPHLNGSEPNSVLRTAICRIMSDMLDNPDENGIYETGRFMDRIEALLVAMMAAPEVLQLSGSEALYGFAGWVTSRKEKVVAGSAHNSAIWAELIDKFCKTNGLAEPRDQWDTLLTHPSDKVA